MKKIELITNDKIAKFAAKSEETIEASKNGRLTASKKVLLAVQESVKNSAENGISAAQIALDISDVFGIKISATTVRNFIKNTLKIDTKNINKNGDTINEDIEKPKPHNY